MSKRGRPVYVWTPRKVVRLRWYAERGLSMREAAILMGTTYGAVINTASRLGIHFAGPPGAPRMNRNRNLGLWRQELRKIAAD